ncbi:hypothetical protein ACLOJK_008750, partial [Asimina triloba]
FLAFSIAHLQPAPLSAISFISTVSQTSRRPPASCHCCSRPLVVLLIADLLSSPFSSSSPVCCRRHSRPHRQFAAVAVPGAILAVVLSSIGVFPLLSSSCCPSVSASPISVLLCLVSPSSLISDLPCLISPCWIPWL